MLFRVSWLIVAPLYVAFIASLSGCAADPAAKGSLYTYVDAQGNLVTVERSARASSSEDAVTSDKPESYQTDEQVQQKLEMRDRNRFVTYFGPDGQLVEQPVDLLAEREYKQNRDPAYQTVENATVEFVERIIGVRADCCAHLRLDARPLAVGDEVSLPLGEARESVSMEQPMPAMALRLTGGVQQLKVRAYIGKSGQYMHPALVFMDSLGVPLEVVDRPFQRRYPETWYRYPFFEGVLSVPENARYIAFYLPYATLEEGAGVSSVPRLQGYYELPPALTGDFTVTGVGERL